jgi:predicted TPR repeat methyltransferase
MTQEDQDKLPPGSTKVSRVSVEDALRVAVEVHQRGLIDEAVTLYSSILEVVPDHIDALHFLGVARHQMGDSAEALKLIERSLAISESQPSALNNIGNINKEIGNVKAAESAYRKVLALAPNHVETMSNLAVTLREQKKLDEALEILERALKINPSHSDSYHNLGNVYRDLKRMDDALIAYRKSMEHQPDNSKSATSIAKLLHDTGRKEEAYKILRRMLARNPEDGVARHMLSAYGGGEVPERASDDYVRQTFDDFASSFDSVLGGLGYAAPELVAERVMKELGGEDRLRRAADLGCGTGLFGPLIREKVELLVGVDLSEKMLARARARDTYDDLIAAELTQFLRDSDSPFDLIACVDTLVYFGDLEGFADAANGALERGGRLFFSVEQHDASVEQGFLLHPHGRYSHSRAYIESTLASAGFDITAIDNVVLRQERGEPVKGMIVAARIPPA